MVRPMAPWRPGPLCSPAGMAFYRIAKYLSAVYSLILLSVPRSSSPPADPLLILPGLLFQSSPGYKDSINVGLATELGLRYMITKAISAEISFKYRYFAPSYSYSGNVPALGTTFNLDSKPDFNLFSGQFGMAYHF